MIPTYKKTNMIWYKFNGNLEEMILFRHDMYGVASSCFPFTQMKINGIMRPDMKLGTLFFCFFKTIFIVDVVMQNDMKHEKNLSSTIPKPPGIDKH